MLIDTHAHIYMNEFRADIHEVIVRALETYVSKILMPNIDGASIEDMLHVEEQFPEHCFSMIGLHPCSVKEHVEKELYTVEEWIGKRPFIAIGEIGTDLYWEKTYWEQQKEAFNIQCELAVKHTLPVVIHCRESVDETIELVKPFSSKGLKGVFHCYTGSVKQAEEITDLGFYLGFGGVSTFKNAGLDRVIPHVKRDKIVLETDSPYLSPTPFRGKRNEPARIKTIAEKVAAYLAISKEETASLTTNNANTLFFPS